MNGVLIGGFGAMHSGGANIAALTPRYAIPDSALNGGDLTIAIRADIGGNSEGGRHRAGFVRKSVMMLGPATILADQTALFFFRQFTSNGVRTVFNLILLVITCALALSMRAQKEYLALAIYLAANLADQAFFLWRTIGNVPIHDSSIAADVIFAAVTGVAILEFVRLVLGYRRTRVYLAYLGLMIFWNTGVGAVYQHFAQLSGVPIPNWIIVGQKLVSAFLFVPIYIGIPWLSLWVGFRRRNRDAFLLAAIFFLTSVFDYYATAVFVAGRLHLETRATISAVSILGLEVQWNEIDEFLSNLVLLVFLLLRTLRLAKSQAKAAAEIQAAQSVQQLLLAKSSVKTPGFEVESVYLPADEVGGDFFLVLPNAEDGSLTAIVGDVSGHGLTAAMRVSMILGVLRREDARGPGAILSSLNQALLSQAEMGFTTACCVRLQSNGWFTLANAGQIPPYVDGREVETAAGLPLGIAPDQEYPEVTGQLFPYQRMVMTSDGVVEARNAKRELYGFARLGTLTQERAQAIADAAQSFGQEDDITVLTLACAV